MIETAEKQLSEILQHAEDGAPYGQPQVTLAAGDDEIFVISDLHLAAGRNINGCYSGTENFFADPSFPRFINACLERLDSRPATLVINGDMIDFLRVTECPQTEAEFLVWQKLLQQLGITKTIQELKESISSKELKFGLKTHEFKSVWQLSKVASGHAPVFKGLALWLAAGNKLILVKGNHDLEFYWPAVRRYMRLILARHVTSVMGKQKSELAATLTERIIPQLSFIDDSIVIDEILYIEHGHRYDRYAWVVGDPVLENGVELNIPFGSFFNRYILNQVELSFPYADNVRPAANLLPLLIRERFFDAMKILFHHIPFALRMIPKRYFYYLFARVGVTVLSLGIPLLLAILFLLSTFPKLGPFLQQIPLVPGGGIAKSFVSLAASYFLSRAVAYFQLAEPFTLADRAREVFAAHPEYKFMTMGHTHNPEQFNDQDRWYYNTGTWIPIVETSSAEIRENKSYSFLHFRRTDGELQPTVVERWDDEAARAEDLVLVSRKP